MMPAGRQRRRAVSAAADALHAGVLLLVPGLAAWATGRHMLFPSLGPTAFLLVVRPGRAASAWSVIGGHLVGVISGMIAWHTIARGVTVGMSAEPMSSAGLQLGVSAVAALVLTVAGMEALRARHAAACATTLIVAMGQMARWSDGLLILAGVIVMFIVHRVLPCTSKPHPTRRRRGRQ